MKGRDKKKRVLKHLRMRNVRWWRSSPDKSQYCLRDIFRKKNYIGFDIESNRKNTLARKRLVSDM
jgi:hypothetical protein